MPTYTYVCSFCEHKFTRISAIDNRDSQLCRKCNSKLIRRPEVGLVWAPTSGRGFA